MRWTFLGAVLGLGAFATSFAACGGGSSSSSTTSGGGATATTGSAGGAGGATSSTSGSTGGGTSTATTATATGTGGGATTTSSTTGTGGPVYGYCTKPCGTVADCCPVGAPNCPSNMYPQNYQCDKAACRPPECMSTSDCAMLDPKQDCFALSGFNSCAYTCASDGDCAAPTTCSGVDDNNKKYCLSPGGAGCANDAACNGFGKCVNKVCVCDQDADCTKPGFTKCAL